MQTSSRKLLYTLLALALLGILVYQSGGFVHKAGFSGTKLLLAVREAKVSLLLLSLVAIYVCYGLRALRWMGFSRHLGPAHFGNIYRMTLAGFSAVFLLGRAGEPVRPLLLARKERLPVADTFGIYALERFFDTASTAVIAAVGLFLFRSRHAAESSTLETAAKTGGTALSLGVAVAAGILIYLRLHGTAMLEKRLRGWHAERGWRGDLARIILGFARGVQTIRTLGDLSLAMVYSAAHWTLVALVYFWVTHSFAGKLGEIGLGGTMLVLAVTMVGSTAQLPTVGGGSQVASILAYTAIFHVEKEPAAAAAIVLWLITFAACSLVGVPLLVHEGMSLGELRRIAERGKEAAREESEGTTPAAAHQGESAE